MPVPNKADGHERQERDALLTKINAAVAAANEAEQTVTAAQAELVSRSKAVGLLLLEAKKLHSVVKDFEAFLKRVDGLGLSRAYDFMRLAGGRTTDEELRADARERQRKSRARKKLPKAKPQPEERQVLLESGEVVIEPDSVTVTESAEASAEKRKAENAHLDLTAKEKAAKASAHYLAEFTAACRSYLPKITIEADREKARLLVSELTSSKPKMKAA
jgi:hypothetical protein